MTPPHPLRTPIPRVSEAARICGLPRAEDAPDLTARFARPGGRGQLRPVQSAVLHQLATVGGCVALVGVGFGKTLISALAPRALGIPGARSLLLLPPGLASSFTAEVEARGEDFDIDPPHLLAYSRLSLAGGEEALYALDPDLLILDEAHYVRRKGAARTKRLLHFLRQRHKAGRPVHLLVLSGTPMTAGLLDTLHLFQWCLGGAAPVPIVWQTAESWARVIDPTPPQGVPPDASDRASLAPLLAWADTTCPRAALEARLSSAPGVVRARGLSADASLYLAPWGVKLPNPVLDALHRLDLTWERPDGSICIDALEVHRTAFQLGCGFYYVWDWGDGGEDLEWLAVRAEWAREMRAYTKRGRPGLDTEGLVTAALTRNPEGFPPPLQRAHAAWARIASRANPTPRPVWLTRAVIDAAARFDGLIWCSHRAVMDALDEAGVEVCRPGTTPAGPRRQLALSVASHGTGLNLQQHHRSLLLAAPQGPAAVEQLLGRTHRPGQPDDVHALIHLPHAFHRAAWAKTQANAAALATTTGQPFRIVPGNHIWLDKPPSPP